MFEEDAIQTSDGRYDLAGVSECTWHGACLTTAELARRGLLLPSRIDDVMPWILRVLAHHDARTCWRG